jgi:uncharacterized protein
MKPKEFAGTPLADLPGMVSSLLPPMALLENLLYYPFPCQSATQPSSRIRHVGDRRTKGVTMGSDADVVLRAIKAVEERDGETLLELYHEDVEFHEAPSLPYGGVVEGVPSLMKQLESAPEDTWLGTWDPVQPTEVERRFDPRVISEQDGEVVVLYQMRAVAPDGERFEAPVIGLYEVRDGKFARAQMFHYDTQGINAFLERARKASVTEAA